MTLRATLSPDQDYPLERIWYTVTDTDDNSLTTYARTPDGRILDSDGADITDIDRTTLAVRLAIESVVPTIDTLDEYQLVYGANGYSVVRYAEDGTKHYTFAGSTEDEARATDSRILKNPAVSVSDDDDDFISL